MGIAWRRKGPAVVGAITLPDGRAANVVIVAPRQHPKGAALLLQGAEGAPEAIADALPRLHPAQVIEVLCMQERAFGDRGLPKPDALPERG